MSNSFNAGMKAGRPSATKTGLSLADLADKKDTVRVNFDLERPDHIRLKVYAARKGKTLAEVLRDCIRELPQDEDS